MEFHQLKTFAEVARTRNLTEASRNLNTSQPAASAHIKALESELGIRLFYRTPKGMVLTKDGEKLLEKAQDILEAMSAFTTEAESMKVNTQAMKQPVKIGLNTRGDVLKVKDVTEAVSTLSPNLELHFLQTLSENITSDLESASIKMGFFYGNRVDAGIECVRLKTFKMVVVYPNSLKSVGTNPSLDDFKLLPWIWTTKGCPFYNESVRYFREKNFTPEKIMYIDDEALVGQMVESGMGCSILSEPIAEMFEQQQMLKIWRGIDLSIDLNLGYLKIHRDDPDVASLRGIVENLWLKL